MIGLDTNILLRWLIGPDRHDFGASRSEVAAVERTLSATGVEYFVNLVVLAETTWVLERKLKVGRTALCEVVDRMLFAANIVVDDAATVVEARRRFEVSNIGFADCLIAQINRAAGCSHTLTFDRKAARQTGFRNIHARD